ncbi:MAG: aldo/keto reductase [Clostridia bacterium]|nr:aldo/keto reductase [Clostridia bacterium]
MRMYTLGSTGITVPQNAFGALPVQRTDTETAVALVRRAYAGGMRFFDTARSYSDSEYKLGIAFEGIDRNSYYLATKTQAKDPETFRQHLETSLNLLHTDHVDIYQFHCADQCYRPGDGTGMYEEMLKAKAEGKILHIGITTHRIGVAEEIISSGLYETLQYPFSYLASEREHALVEKCANANMGFIAMKGLCGGILTNSAACMAYMTRYPVLPIWGIQRDAELSEWLSFFDREPEMTPELSAMIEADRKELATDFCRGCGYCEPCTAGIQIHNCARMTPMIRRSPSAGFLSEYWQAEMARIDECVDCGICKTRCPYGLDTPNLLRRNLEDYRNILSGKTKI